MIEIDLPISKSIANRLLIMQALHGDALMNLPEETPEDIQVLHQALTTILAQPASIQQPAKESITVQLGNCGTAMRFLTAFCAQRMGCNVILDGSARMCERPIAPLVQALRATGAKIEYLGKEGYPPLHIQGVRLNNISISLTNPESTQFVSALVLAGFQARSDRQSQYIELSVKMAHRYHHGIEAGQIDKDWSAAAFWYEWVALHHEEVLLRELSSESKLFVPQADCEAEQIFRHLGVETIHTDEGILLRPRKHFRPRLRVNFRECPDLYPAVVMTYKCLGFPLWARGIDALRIKESDRIAALESVPARAADMKGLKPVPANADHRIAMALMAADYPVDDTDCIRKSYPKFLDQIERINSRH